MVSSFTCGVSSCLFGIVFCCFLLILATAYQECLNVGGGYCPDGNTCCPLSRHQQPQQQWGQQQQQQPAAAAAGCIPNDLGSFHAVCCPDLETGCPVGYICGQGSNCFAGPNVSDPLVQVLPRYQLCRVGDEIRRVHGFSIVGGAAAGAGASLAYYSSHGDLAKCGNKKNNPCNDIRMILVVVHGTDRNADDYFCSTKVAVERQTIFRKESVWVIAPRFAYESDAGLDALVEGGVAMRWAPDQGEHGDGPGWRSGSNAISPKDAVNVSSYHAVDRMMEFIFSGSFPNLRRVAIVGHSAGGQFVQRWSMMTEVWDDRLRSVVANPSSYAYLTPLRVTGEGWSSVRDCEGYNQWQWGLDSGGNYSFPYIADVLTKLDVQQIRDRFAKRKVVYMIGGQDKCSVPGHNPKWCYSHGLESSCMDQVQGSNRFERHQNYMASLRLLGLTSHRRLLVPNVGHDHSLMINSIQGMEAVFGAWLRHEENKTAALTVEASILKG